MVRTRRGRTSGTTKELWYHLTDRARFALDASFKPADNAVAIEDRSGRAGIYLSPDVEKWVNGHGYWRPFVVEIAVDPAVKKDSGIHGRYSGEMFVPASSFHRLEIVRVIPIDAYAREQYGGYGWIEQDLRREFDTDRPITSQPWEYPFRKYRYVGPDVREMTSEEISRLKGMLRERQAILNKKGRMNRTRAGRASGKKGLTSGTTAAYQPLRINHGLTRKEDEARLLDGTLVRNAPIPEQDQDPTTWLTAPAKSIHALGPFSTYDFGDGYFFLGEKGKVYRISAIKGTTNNWHVSGTGDGEDVQVFLDWILEQAPGSFLEPFAIWSSSIPRLNLALLDRDDEVDRFGDSPVSLFKDLALVGQFKLPIKTVIQRMGPANFAHLSTGNVVYQFVPRPEMPRPMAYTTFSRDTLKKSMREIGLCTLSHRGDYEGPLGEESPWELRCSRKKDAASFVQWVEKKIRKRR